MAPYDGTYKPQKSKFNPALLDVLGLKLEDYYITYILNNIKMNAITKKWGAYELKPEVITVLNLPVSNWRRYYSEFMIRKYIVYTASTQDNIY